MVNQTYFREGRTICAGDREIPVRCYEEEAGHREISVISGYSQNVLDMGIFDAPNVKIYTLNVGITDGYMITWGYFETHAEEFDRVYDRLADERSKECMYANLYGRLTGRDPLFFAPGPWTDPQYVFDELMEWKERECYIDCGAYTGDSVEEFLGKIPRDQVKEAVVYALEPDAQNFQSLHEKYRGSREVRCLCTGAYSGKCQLRFSSGAGEGAAVSGSGTVSISVDSIDNILSGEGREATFIKMDVEGSEEEVLKGARGQITEFAPRLAVCVYHKRDDLYRIPQLVLSYNSKYDLYLRTHSSMASELALFCIPGKHAGS